MTETNKGTREQFVVVVFFCLVLFRHVERGCPPGSRACWLALPRRASHPVPPLNILCHRFRALGADTRNVQSVRSYWDCMVLCPKGFRPVSACCLVINLTAHLFCGEINERSDRDNDKCAVTRMAHNVLEVYRL
jgi:hypothetical protein